jgi:hypothetical protein
LIRRFLTFLAKMGLTVRDDPKKVVDVAGRTWGEAVDGLALSVLLSARRHDDEPPSVSVAIHNRGPDVQRLLTRGWLNYFRVSVVDVQGASVAMTPYGRESMKPERLPAPAEVVLAPGEAIEADIPVGLLFEMRRGEFRVQATCEAPGGGVIASNEIQVSSAR